MCLARCFEPGCAYKKNVFARWLTSRLTVNMAHQIWNQLHIPPLDVKLNEECTEGQDDLDRLICLRFKDVLKYDQRHVPKTMNVYGMINLSTCSLTDFKYLPAFNRSSIYQGWYEPFDDSQVVFCACLNYCDEERLVPLAYLDIYKSFYQEYENSIKPALAHLHYSDRDAFINYGGCI